MCKSLGVKMLPYFHLYRGQRGKLSQFTASISKVQRLRDAIAKNTGDAWDPNGERRHDSDVAEELSALVNGEASRVESDPDLESDGESIRSKRSVRRKPEAGADRSREGEATAS